MKTVGMIVEYNPLHNGHVLHYTQSKQITGSDAVIAVMSGPFLQRGEPAIVGKRARTEMALHMGADLVIELPVAYAAQPAEWFAWGACALLNATGVVDSLCFGSEAGSLDLLQPLAGQLADESGELRQEISRRTASGLSFPKAYAGAAASILGETIGEEASGQVQELLAQPNNTLGLHYLIALQRLGSSIMPYTIGRVSAGYHDLKPSGSPIASATAVRRLIFEQGLEAAAPYIPEYTLEILSREFAAGSGPVDWESFRQPLFHTLLARSPSELEQLHEVSEGLEHRISKMLPLLDKPEVAALINALKTKRYTRTKLQRMLLHILLNHSKEKLTRGQLSEGPRYIRVLGFSGKGRTLLKHMKKTASLPVVMKPSHLDHPQLSMDIRASAVYGNACPCPDTRSLYEDYFLPPVTL